MADSLDLTNRDPNNINDHLQVRLLLIRLNIITIIAINVVINFKVIIINSSIINKILFLRVCLIVTVLVYLAKNKSMDYNEIFNRRC